MITIKKSSDNFEREPLRAPFGFKGGYLGELWQTVACLTDDAGRSGVGLGTQSILWSDAAVFTANSEAAGNCLMYMMSAFALRRAVGMSFKTPLELLDRLLPETHAYGQKLSGNPDLRLTFALNALVAVDNAAWQLYAAANGCRNFDAAIPSEFHSALSARHTQIACIPLLSYGVPVPEIRRSVQEDGFFFFKIKIGCDPDGDGDREKMLAWDMQRLADIHYVLKDLTTPHTTTGRIPYYLDANGRYDNKDRLCRLLDHAAKIGALERIVLLEEPFPEEMEQDVSDLPVRLAADESAHSAEDARRLMDMGYSAIALKPIAKTLSMGLRIARLAAERQVPCFCADLTVNPVLVDWNKNVAARLAPLPGMTIGVLETNGHQNYRNWDDMVRRHPCHGAPWTTPVRGVFNLDDDFYSRSGGIFMTDSHYSGLVQA